MQRIMLISILAALTMAAPGYAQDPVSNAYGGASEVAGAIARGGQGTGVAREIARGGERTGVGGENARGGGVAGENARGGGVAGEMPVVGGRTGVGNDTSPAPAAGGAAPVVAAQPLRGNRLPFTGLDMALLVLAGGILLAIGLALRHVGRHPIA